MKKHWTGRPSGNAALLRRLLATSSLVSLMAGAATQAQADLCHINNAVTVTSIAVSSTSFTGNVCNTGTISPGGINVTNSTITGQILDTGTIAGGIKADANSKVSPTSFINAIDINISRVTSSLLFF